MSLSLALLSTLAGLAAGGTCSGYDEEWGECQDQKPCDVCSPVDCAFSEWGSWYAGGGCTGLVFRQRTIQVTNNECGKPCTGSKIQSMQKIASQCVLEKQDCVLSGWSAWSACRSPMDQSYRTRTVASGPLNDGKACDGHMRETRPCGGGPSPEPCVFSEWRAWTDCSASCGEGRHTRMRKVQSEAAHNGAACTGTTLETRPCQAEKPCPSQDCKLGQWGEWSLCEEGIHTQRYRSREVAQPAIGDGRQCTDDALRETSGCPLPEAVDCELSAWTSWAACDKSCDGGQTFRSRFLKNPMSNNGKCAASALKEAAPCATAPCVKPPADCEVSEWGSWSACSAKCGSGTKTRQRKVVKLAERGGFGCTDSLEQMSPCESAACDVADCQWSSWYDWSACTASCGGGSKRRSRVVATAPRNGGALCEPLTKSEAVPCNTESCTTTACIDGKWAEWYEWTDCSATCSSGFRSRRREVAQSPTECGRALSGTREEFQACAHLPPCTPDIDCALSDWQEWSSCSGTCYGIRERNRLISVFSKGRGKACEASALKEIESCNPSPRDAPLAECTVPKQDASLSQWSEWGECSSPCGGGQKTKTRRLLTAPENGGATLSETLSLTAPCNTQHCGPVEPCVDCQWGQWSAWGECSKCGGQRYRHRSIERMNNQCGKPCDLASAKEVTNCTSLCITDDLFCAWTKWSEPSGCSATCGAGSTTLRNRALGLSKNPEGSLFSGAGGMHCSGLQLSLETCPAAAGVAAAAPRACKDDCVPRHGEFTAWSEWTSPTCVGLCERERSIAVVNNECGIPPRGPLTETKRCESHCEPELPCLLSAWGAWSKCEDPDGQSFRVRTITQLPSDRGAPCEGSLNQTKACSTPCEPIPCMLTEWSGWGACARSCGGGWQTRSRRVVSAAVCGGEPCDERLEEMRMCNEAPCNLDLADCKLGAWGPWTGCGMDKQRYRERRVETLAEGGRPCDGNLQETQTCEVKVEDCLASEWTEWEQCEKTCGGGQQHRQRQIHRYPSNGGKSCPQELMETRGCNAVPCSVEDCELSDWSAWDACTTTCGTGMRLRSREVLRNRNLGGVGCAAALSEAVPCENLPCDVTDCAWGGWSEWSSCSCTCGGGMRSRDRHIQVSPRHGGKECPVQDREEVEPCNTQACSAPECVDGQWSEWTEWSICSETCGGGSTFRTRKVAVMASDCGSPAAGKDREMKFCNAEVSCEPEVDCVFSDWDEWSDCSKSCSGIKRRSRRIATYGRGAGAFCLGGLKETAPCNPSEGGLTPPDCAAKPPEDCLLSSWTMWGQCSASCDGGEMVRSREVLREPKHGGKPCISSLSEVSECGREPCVVHDPKDCKFGDWQEWGVCSKCGGERKRYRNIVQYAENGGQNCEPTAHEEMGICPQSCGAATFCTWSSWKEWGPCTSDCGVGRRSRRRYLEITQKEPHGFALRQFEELKLRNQQLLARQAGAPVFAFACGCFSFLLAFAGVRLFAQRPRSRRMLEGARPLQGASDDEISTLE